MPASCSAGVPGGPCSITGRPPAKPCWWPSGTGERARSRAGLRPARLGPHGRNPSGAVRVSDVGYGATARASHTAAPRRTPSASAYGPSAAPTDAIAPPAGPGRGADVREGGDRIGEEHHPETGYAGVELGRPERVHLRVTLHEHRVSETGLRGVGPGPGEHRAGEVQADRLAWRDEPCRRQRRAAAAAAHVEHVPAGPQGGGIEDHGRERRIHAVIARLVDDPVGDALAGVPVLGLLGVRDTHLSSPHRWIVPAESAIAPTLTSSSAARSRPPSPAAPAPPARAGPSRSTRVLATPCGGRGPPRPAPARRPPPPRAARPAPPPPPDDQ